MLRKLLLPVIALALGGCFHPFGTDPSIKYHADKAFTPVERQCIDASAKQWSDQTSGIGSIEVDYDYDPTKAGSVIEHKLDDKLQRWTSDTKEVLEIESEREPGETWHLLGLTQGKLTNPIRTPITVSLVVDQHYENWGKDLDMNMCMATTIHEFGHAFGIPHLGKKTDIMFPMWEYGRKACLKSDDLTAFAVIQNAPMGLMKPCPDEPDSTFQDNVVFEFNGDGDTWQFWTK